MYLCKKLRTFRFLTTVLTVLIVVFIFTQSLMPGKVSGEESGKIVALLNSITTSLGLGELFTQSFVRTCAHFTEFAVLGISLCSMYHFYFIKLGKNFIFTILSFSLTAVLDECIQLFSKDRAFQISDILIDICGAMFGSVLVLTIILIKRDRKSPNKLHNQGVKK